ncbi:MAG TPA: kelch repeat-containing protein [Solirubrobacterales bacterium]|nr:kelch repeat-containing protein [Solirubrobacterales bacterium]
MEEKRQRRWALIPLVLVGAIVLLLPLSAALDLPLERQVKDALGLDYKEEGCAPIHDRGVWGAWRKEGHTPTLLEEGRAVTVGDSAYLVGGLTTQVVDNFGKSTAAFRRYDFDTGKFESLPDLPERLNHVGMAAQGNDVYVVGGLGDQLEFLSEASPALFRYDIPSQTWVEMPPMRTPRGALGAAFVGDDLFAVGGRNGTDSYATVEMFDTKTDRWSNRAPLPGGRDHLGVASLGGFVYAVGGRYDGGPELAEFLRYNPRTNEWKRLQDLPTGTSGVTLERVGDELAITGGEDSEQAWVTGRTFAYSPQTGRWRNLADSPRPKHGYASTGHDGRLYVFGGAICAGSTPTDTIESLRVSKGS